MSQTGSGNSSHGDGSAEVDRKHEKHEAPDKSGGSHLQQSVDRNSQQEHNKRAAEERSPEQRLPKQTAGRATFGECAIADVRLCGKNQDTVVALKNGLPDKFQTHGQHWERDAKNPKVWHVREGENKFDLCADVKLQGDNLFVKVKYPDGREIAYSNGKPSEIIHPGGEKWTADSRNPGFWDVQVPDKNNPGITHNARIRGVKIGTADGAISREADSRADSRTAASDSGASDSGVEWLNRKNCSSATQSFWSEMTKIPKENYNCEFAVQAFIKRSTLHESEDISIFNMKLPGALHPASMTSGDSVRNALKENGWVQHNELTLDSAGHKPGEVVLIAGKDGPHAAIVGQVSAGRIMTLEQKPNPTDPPIVTTVDKFKSMYQPKEGQVNFFRAAESAAEPVHGAARAPGFLLGDHKRAAETPRPPVGDLLARAMPGTSLMQTESAQQRELPSRTMAQETVNTNSMLRALRNAYMVPKGFRGYAGTQGQDHAIHTYNGQTLQQAGFRSYMNIKRRPG
jgi:hypothetical protein